MLHFELLKTEGLARRGRLRLNRGVVETPVFMPVGTYGTVKGVLPRSLHEMGAQIILGNTFHLWMRPGLDVLAKFGGLHRFEGWQQPILTDSGGFQVWSLGEMRKISEEGVRFASPVNGDKLFLTPEVSMQIQTVLDSDIVMQFDECTPYETQGRITSEAEARASMELSLRWARRSRAEFERLGNRNALFGIVQGGMFEALREESLAALAELAGVLDGERRCVARGGVRRVRAVGVRAVGVRGRQGGLLRGENPWCDRQQGNPVGPGPGGRRHDRRRRGELEGDRAEDGRGRGRRHRDEVQGPAPVEGGVEPGARHVVDRAARRRDGVERRGPAGEHGTADGGRGPRAGRRR